MEKDKDDAKKAIILHAFLTTGSRFKTLKEPWFKNA